MNIRNIKLVCFLLLVSAGYAQNINITFQSQFQYPGKTCANICGYVDSTGKEYALVGVETGMSIVDVSNPAAPFQVTQLPWPAGPSQLWKEIKVYKNYAYITSEAPGGLQIADLRHLPTNNIPFKYWTPTINAVQLSTIHALHIDTTLENVYLYGHNISNSGAICASLADGWNPVFLGIFDQGYVHDGYVDNDTLYAGQIFAGTCSIIDFTNKSNPQVIASFQTPGQFTHNTWLAPDRNILLTTDEVSNSYLVSYDISNLSNITELDRVQSNPGSNSIVHNTHITLDSFAVTSWYRDGLTITDIKRPHNLIQVGNYDTYSGTGNGFDGAWGVYPFLPSKTLVVSNINEGLFVLSPNYVRACYLEGNVKDSITNANLSNVQVQIIGISQSTTTTPISPVTGDYATGCASAGTYSVQFSKAGYQTRTISNLSLSNGVLTLLNVKLLPNGAGVNDLGNEKTGITLLGNPVKQSISLSYDNELITKNSKLKVLDGNGKLIEEILLDKSDTRIEIGKNYPSGMYFLQLDNYRSVQVLKSY